LSCRATGTIDEEYPNALPAYWDIPTKEEAEILISLASERKLFFDGFTGESFYAQKFKNFSGEIKDVLNVVNPAFEQLHKLIQNLEKNSNGNNQ